MLSLILCSILAGHPGQSPARQTPIEQSKALVLEWSAIIANDKRTAAQRESDRSWSLDTEFERINGGCDGSLATLATFLNGNDVALRRAAATVVGSIRTGVGNEPTSWRVFRGKELGLAANYVMDRDPLTAANAVNSFVDLLGGESWDQWSHFQPIWLRSLTTVKSPQSRGLAKLFAFTSVPVEGSAPGLRKLSDSSDPETRSFALDALARAYILDPTATEAAILNDAGSKSEAKRAKAIADLQTTAAVIWDPRSTYSFVSEQRGLSQSLQSAWVRCTMRTRPLDWRRQVAEAQDSHARILQALEQGLNERNGSIRLSSANALVTIGKIVDRELSWGFKNSSSDDKPEVARLLRQASRTVQVLDPGLATQAQSIATGFDRTRIIG